jgi:hypothetical protein
MQNWDIISGVIDVILAAAILWQVIQLRREKKK